MTTAVRSLFLLLGALAVLALGTFGTAAPAEASGPPCHETGLAQDQDRAPSPMKAMACCVVCVTSPAVRPRQDAGPAIRVEEVRIVPRPTALPPGVKTVPEHGPPRA
jgi:hypothetical protein